MESSRWVRFRHRPLRSQGKVSRYCGHHRLPVDVLFVAHRSLREVVRVGLAAGLEAFTLQGPVKRPPRDVERLRYRVMGFTLSQ